MYQGRAVLKRRREELLQRPAEIVEHYISAKKSLDIVDDMPLLKCGLDPTRDQIASYSDDKLDPMQACVVAMRRFSLTLEERIAVELVDPLELDHKIALVVWPMFRNKVTQRRRYRMAEIPEILAEHFSRDWSSEHYKDKLSEARKALKERIDRIK
jgi:hypothetical protein